MYGIGGSSPQAIASGAGDRNKVFDPSNISMEIACTGFCDLRVSLHHWHQLDALRAIVGRLRGCGPVALSVAVVLYHFLLQYVFR